jgi:ribosome-associated toxin RatA of RatAB toxin-antitoxin module
VRHQVLIVRSAISIDIDAPPDLVFDLCREPLRWPDLLPHYVRADLIARERGGAIVVRYVALRPVVRVLGIGFPVAWRSRSWSKAETRRIRFQHLGGATAGMDVTWQIDAVRDGCRVTIEHTFRPRLGPWGLLVDRLFVRPVAARTLATFKALAEILNDRASMGALAAAVGASVERPRTKIQA